MNFKMRVLLPVLFSFFVMGFVDITGISVSYVKQDFGLSDTVANLIPMMVFLWFAVLSIPTGWLMNRKGRKKTVLLSALVTTVAMALPLVNYTFPMMLLAFTLLGIGNTILQVSLNPLMADVAPVSRLTSMLSLGQFIKAISSTLAPILISLSASMLGSWQYIFPTYAVLTLLSWIWLVCQPIAETPCEEKREGVSSLLGDKYVLLFLSVIVLSVGFEVGLISAVPKYLLERFGMPIERGSYACSLYYVARTIGTFAGTIILARMQASKFQIVTVAIGLLSFAGFLCAGSEWMAMATLFAIGLFCANIFPATFGVALQYKPTQANGISSLMITGVAGGAVVPPLMGLLSDATNQWISLFIPLALLLYIWVVAFQFKKTENKNKQ